MLAGAADGSIRPWRGMLWKGLSGTISGTISGIATYQHNNPRDDVPDA